MKKQNRLIKNKLELFYHRLLCKYWNDDKIAENLPERLERNYHFSKSFSFSKYCDANHHTLYIKIDYVQPLYFGDIRNANFYFL